MFWLAKRRLGVVEHKPELNIIPEHNHHPIQAEILERNPTSETHHLLDDMNTQQTGTVGWRGQQLSIPDEKVLS